MNDGYKAVVLMLFAGKVLKNHYDVAQGRCRYPTSPSMDP